MSKKKTPVRKKQTYIAIDNNTDKVIAIGTLDDIKKQIEEYVDLEYFGDIVNGDDFYAIIKVFELTLGGKRKDIAIHTCFNVVIL